MIRCIAWGVSRALARWVSPLRTASRKSAAAWAMASVEGLDEGLVAELVSSFDDWLQPEEKQATARRRIVEREVRKKVFIAERSMRFAELFAVILGAAVWQNGCRGSIAKLAPARC
jgi:hypothetical protein